MRAQSAKAKGRKFQQEVRKLLIDIIVADPADVTSRPMGSPGEDIIMGVQTREKFPYSIECKHRKSYKELYDAYQQAVDNCPKGVEPLFCVRTDYKKPLAVVDLEHFMKLVAENQDLRELIHDGAA